MNITINQNRFNTPDSYKKYNNRVNSGAGTKLNAPLYQNNTNRTPSFTGWNPFDILPVKSKFLDPLNRAFDKFTTGIAEYYTAKLYTSPVAKWLAKHTEKLGGVVDHMQVAGSVIISGMYMIQTLRQKDLDDDRKKTLAINQGLTFASATLGAYLIDDSLDSMWEKVTQKYASKQLPDEKLSEKIRNLNEAIMKDDLTKANRWQDTFDTQNIKKQWKKLGKKEKSPLVNTLKYIEDNAPNTGLESKIRGMGVLKKLLVFGTVYRFLSPVLVTPIASKIGDRITSDKKQEKDKAAEAPASGNTSQTTPDKKKPEETKQAA